MPLPKEPLQRGSATLRYGADEIELAVEHPTLGRDALDVSNLASHGLTVYDPGYADTAAYRSAITFVDGEAGRLYYRGYPVEELATSVSFLEVAYLLIYGELPSGHEAEEFVAKVRDPQLILHPAIERLFDWFPESMHPMAMLAIATEALTAYSGHEDIDAAGVRLLSSMPIFAGYAMSVLRGLPRSRSNRSLDYVEDFLQLCFGAPGSGYLPDTSTARALNTLLVLHADHEINCSTATLRLVASSGTGFFPSVAAAINALWGPLHGGANQAVTRMLQEIKDSGKPLSYFVDKAKDHSDPFRLMGFGHRVYKNYDARAKVIRQIALDLVEKLAPSDPLLDIALQLEEVALADEYFISRRLYPNVDFYSGIIYRAIGFPDEMFTPLFVLGRSAGWVAHWREMAAAPAKIGRPTQLYVGPTKRSVQRSASRA
jgi:citrate synthase